MPLSMRSTQVVCIRYVNSILTATVQYPSKKSCHFSFRMGHSTEPETDLNNLFLYRFRALACQCYSRDQKKFPERKPCYYGPLYYPVCNSRSHLSSFAVSSVPVLNCLPNDVVEVQSYPSFKRRLKLLPSL